MVGWVTERSDNPPNRWREALKTQAMLSASRNIGRLSLRSEAQVARPWVSLPTIFCPTNKQTTVTARRSEKRHAFRCMESLQPF